MKTPFRKRKFVPVSAHKFHAALSNGAREILGGLFQLSRAHIEPRHLNLRKASQENFGLRAAFL